MSDHGEAGTSRTVVYVPDLEAAERMRVAEFFARHPQFDLRVGRTLAADEETVASELGDAEVVCVALGRVGAAAITQAPRLRLIVKCGIGVDNIDVEAARSQGIGVIRAGRVNSRGPAEWVIGAAIAHYRRFAEMTAAMRDGAWQQMRTQWAGLTPALTGRTLAIAGLGAIGRYLAQLGHAHGMEVIAFDPYAEPVEHVQLLDRETLLARADVLSLNMVLTPETRHWLSDAEFALMKPSALLCNSSRGPVIDESALLRALRQGRIAGAALDVYETEPLASDSPLLAMENVILTPHLAGCTDHGYAEIGELSVEMVRRFFAGEQIPDYCVVAGAADMRVAQAS